jgi:ubiquinone/menaquinone biosynthesis C-methylase UbiE
MAEPTVTQFMNRDEIIKKAQIFEGMKVADLGCGNLGYFIIPIAKLLGREGKAYAVDVLNSALDSVHNQAKLEGITNLERVRTNLEKIGATNIPADSLDLALLINVLFQNKKHKDILQEAIRLLKKGGKLFIIDWKKTGAPFGPQIENRLDPMTIKTIAQDLDLNLIEETEIGEYFWGLIFEKN